MYCEHLDFDTVSFKNSLQGVLDKSNNDLLLHYPVFLEYHYVVNKLMVGTTEY